MKIKSIKLKEHLTGWEIKKIDLDKLSLLVGISGVGKTKILQSIINLRNIALGQIGVNGLEWELDFSIAEDNFTWKGKFKSDTSSFTEVVSNIYSNPNEMYGNKPVFESESLIKNDIVIFKREQEKTIFNEKEVPKVSSSTSLLNIFSSEDILSEVVNSFKYIYLIDSRVEGSFLIPLSMSKSSDSSYKNIEDIRGLNTPVLNKLYLVSKHFKEEFSKIKEEFIETFDQVEDIRFFHVFNKAFNEEFITLQLKEKNSNWVNQENISLGMLKSLIYISEMSLLSDGSIILIDEFENSLGVNCIDSIADYIIFGNRNLQFIITSHHPYIINSISLNNWLVIRRKGNSVYGQKTSELNIGNSRHEAFKQLINSKEYIKGIE